MTVRISKTFQKDYIRLPLEVRKKVDRQIQYLTTDIRHPGLRAKRVQGTSDIWEGRVDIHHRFTFQIAEPFIVLRKVGPHDILRNP